MGQTITRENDSAADAMKTANHHDSPLDIRNRQPFIDDIIHLLDTISESQASYTFALNGKWGVGKSFVLDMLRRDLRKDPYDTKYVVFHYNCWQYDFYEEPLIAILTAMIDCLDAELHLIPPEANSVSRQIFSELKPKLSKAIEDFVRTQYGLDLSGLISLLSKATDLKEKAGEEAKARKSFDPNHSLRKTIDAVRKDLEMLTGDRTLVVIVDELDRCLPNYAIKVLERLHHLFYGLSSTAVILSIDKEQLVHSIRLLFGSNTNADNYLRKLISFELTLGPGQVMENFPYKYASYFNLFDENALLTKFPPDDAPIFRHTFDHNRFFSALLTGIEPRSLERLMDRCLTIHKLLFPDVKKDYSFLCMEIMWLVLAEIHGYTTMPLRYDQYDSGLFYCVADLNISTEFIQTFNTYLAENWNDIVPQYTMDDEHRQCFRFSQSVSIAELLVWYLSRLFQNGDQGFWMPKIDYDTPYKHVLKSLRDQNLADLKKFIRYLNIIK